jgi:hypothetical protein
MFRRRTREYCQFIERVIICSRHLSRHLTYQKRRAWLEARNLRLSSAHDVEEQEKRNRTRVHGSCGVYKIDSQTETHAKVIRSLSSLHSLMIRPHGK